MATFHKLVGTLKSFFQFGGTGGPGVNANGAALEVRNATNTAFAVARCAAPVASSDACTKNYYDTGGAGSIASAGAFTLDATGVLSIGPTHATSIPLGNAATCTNISRTCTAAGTVTTVLGTVTVETWSKSAVAANSQSLSPRNVLWGYATSTDAATAQTIATVPIPASSVVRIAISVVGRDRVAGTVGDGVTFANGATPMGWKNVGGVVTALAVTGSLQNAHDASMATCACALTIVGTNVLVQVNGLAAVTIDWTAIITYDVC